MELGREVGVVMEMANLCWMIREEAHLGRGEVVVNLKGGKKSRSRFPFPASSTDSMKIATIAHRIRDTSAWVRSQSRHTEENFLQTN